MKYRIVFSNFGLNGRWVVQKKHFFSWYESHAYSICVYGYDEALEMAKKHKKNLEELDKN